MLVDSHEAVFFVEGDEFQSIATKRTPTMSRASFNRIFVSENMSEPEISSWE